MSEANHNYCIGLASYNYDADGDILLSPLWDGTDIRAAERRLSRTKTLDGGVVITDGGRAAGDRTFYVSCQSEESIWNTLRGIASNNYITIATDEACFKGKLQKLSEKNGKITIEIMIESDLTV